MYVLRELFRYFMDHPRQMPGEYIRQIPLYGEDQAVCDYIAGMTDNYAIRTFRELFVPSSWKQL